MRDEDATDGEGDGRPVVGGTKPPGCCVGSSAIMDVFDSEISV